MFSFEGTGEALASAITRHHDVYVNAWSPKIAKTKSEWVRKEMQRQAVRNATIHWKWPHQQENEKMLFSGFGCETTRISNISSEYCHYPVGGTWLIIRTSPFAKKLIETQEIEAYAKSLGKEISLDATINGVFGCACPSQRLIDSYRERVSQENVLFAALVGTGKGLGRAIDDGLAYENELFMPHGVSSDDPLMPYLTRRCQDIGIIKSLSW